MKKIFIGLLALGLGFSTAELFILQPTSAQTHATPDAKTELERLMKLAGQQIGQGQTDQAIVTLQQVLLMARRLSLKQWEAKTLTVIGVVYTITKQPQKTLEYYHQALPIIRAINDKSWEATTLTGIGDAYDRIGQSPTALEYYKQALPIVRAVNNKPLEALTLNNIGAVYSRTGQPHQALEHYHQALQIVRVANDKGREAATLNNIGVVYVNIGKPQKALEYYNQALPIHRVANNKVGEATTLTGIGLVYANIGQPQKALKYYNQALLILRSVSNKAEEANTLNNMGAVYANIGQPQKALEYYNQALLILRNVSNKAGEANTLNNMGAVYANIGQPQKALEYYNQALPILRAVNDKAAEASTLNNMGNIYYSTGQPQSALEHYKQALPISRASNHKVGEATTLSNIGFIYDTIGQSQKALEYYHQVLPIRKATNDKVGEANTLNNIGFIYMGSGELKNALKSYNQSLLISKAIDHKDGEAITLSNLSTLERSQGNLQSALTYIEAAIKIIETIRTELSSQELRTSYFASQQYYYRIYIDLLMQLHKQQPKQGFDVLAFNASERSRARGLLDLLNEANIDIRQGVNSKLLAQEKMLQQQVSALEKRRIQILSGNHTPEQVAALEQDYKALQNQYQQNQEQIRRTSPRYANLTQPQPLTLAEIQQQVLDDNTLLLVYSLSKDRSYLWAISKTSLSSYELPKDADISKLARQVYSLFTDKRYDFVKTELEQASTQLSQMLLGAVASQLGQKRLVVVADGALQYLPFTALPIPQGNGQTTAPLLSQHELINLPSASTLAILRRDTQGRKPAPKTVAVIADPVFGKDDPRLQAPGKAPAQSNSSNVAKLSLQRSASQTGVSFSRLENTRLEAEAIAQLVPPDQQRLDLGFAANLSNATSPQLSQYRMVHFATHGLLNSETPELSGVVLSLVNDKGEPENGFLRLQEIFNLNLSADLVVLSACKTGLGKDIQGEGLVGLTRGFMYAGAPRVVVSLWNVDDRATALLMSEFYRGILQKRLSPAVALRQAQQALMQQPEYQAPYYWAAFTLQGEWK
jgi:CHAT domain-containing protein/Tfp pilus assembly protein PilF